MSRDSGLGIDPLPDLPNKRTSKRKFIRESWQPSHKYHASMASLLNFIQTYVDARLPSLHPLTFSPQK